ncbi:MAG TPA: hypothetical protein VJU52_11525 [Flavobacterium sp.]|nr:hypothetical protein [Flavobacterium sp.]
MEFRNIYRFVLLITVVVATFVSCSNDDSKNTVDDVSDAVKDGTWKVSYFYNSGKDETVNYVGYDFTFGGNNVLTATKEANSYTGMWSVVKSTSDNDLFSTIFKVSIGPNDFFQDLNRDWKVIENTGTSVKLKDDSKGETAIDYLTFEKNTPVQ